MQRRFGYALALGLALTLILLIARRSTPAHVIAAAPPPRRSEIPAEVARPAQPTAPRKALAVPARSGSAGAPAQPPEPASEDAAGAAARKHDEEAAAAEYSPEALEEAGVTKRALYAARADIEWLSIGRTLHEAGYESLSNAAVALVATWSNAMQPYAPQPLSEALTQERTLVARLRAEAPADLKVRGFHATLGDTLKRVEHDNSETAQGRGPSVAAKIRDAQREAAERAQHPQQNDRQSYRPWSTNPAELQEEIQDRTDGDHDQRAAQGLEAPADP